MVYRSSTKKKTIVVVYSISCYHILSVGIKNENYKADRFSIVFNIFTVSFVVCVCVLFTYFIYEFTYYTVHEWLIKSNRIMEE